MSSTLPLPRVALYLMILLIIIAGGTLGIIMGLKNRIEKLEDRVARVETIDHRITELREQVKVFDQFQENIQRLETRMNARMDHMVQDLDAIQKKMAQEPPRKAEFSKPMKVLKKPSKKRYHMVKPGDTLYGISHRYGLTVKEIQHLNHLTGRSLIHPGQKLLIAS